jgi:hypothetical protein
MLTNFINWRFKFQQRMDQYELPVTPIERIIHIANSRMCPECGKVHEAVIPDEVKRQGMIGERLTAYIATPNTSGRVTLRPSKRSWGPWEPTSASDA